MEEINNSAFVKTKRTFKFIGMVFTAMLLCLNLTACGGDDDEDDGGSGTQTTTDSFGVITGEKKLTKLVEDYGTTDNTVTFTYDNNGRLAKVVRVHDYGGTNPEIITYTYKWNETDKSITINDEEGLEFKGYIKNGKLEKASYYFESNEERTSTMTYKNGKLSTCDYYSNEGGKEEHDHLGVFVWNNDKLTETYDQLDGENEYTYTYSGNTCKGYYPYIIDITDSYLLGAFHCGAEYLIYAHPELLGLRTNQLPESICEDESYDYYKPLCYDDGYLRMMTETGGCSYTFTWE